MTIRRAIPKDLDAINRLLHQVYAVHQSGRPDLFRPVSKKYTDEQILAILADDSTPVFAAVNDSDEMTGYAFCILQTHAEDNRYKPGLSSMYIDDLCVDETVRGTHVGTQLYEYVCSYAKSIGCYNVTLNVWSCNEKALGFYEHIGLKPYEIGMEKIL
ncbi:MAG: GNAT family N-acetyltransferase [Clostridia bacterium]|nr:GNAT family N-acetyltransferase [Clostridia bacterium]